MAGSKEGVTRISHRDRKDLKYKLKQVPLYRFYCKRVLKQKSTCTKLLANQVISNTGFDSPCSTQKKIYGGRAAASPLWKPGELALRGPQGHEPVESVEPLCARLKRWGLHSIKCAAPVMRRGPAPPFDKLRVVNNALRGPQGQTSSEPQSNSEPVESVEPLCARLKRRGLH